MNIGPLGREGGGPLVFPVGDGGAGYSRELAEYALGNFQGFPKLADVSGGRAGVPFQDALRDILQNPELFFQILVGIQVSDRPGQHRREIRTRFPGNPGQQIPRQDLVGANGL